MNPLPCGLIPESYQRMEKRECAFKPLRFPAVRAYRVLVLAHLDGEQKWSKT